MKILISVLLIETLTGCSTVKSIQSMLNSKPEVPQVTVYYESYMDSYFKDVNSKQKKYFIVLNDRMGQLITARKIADEITSDLSHAGYQMTLNSKEADFVIVYYAGIGERTVQTISPVYVPGQSFTMYSGGKTTTGYTSGTITQVPSSYEILIRWLSIQIFDAELIRQKSNDQHKSIWIYESSSSGRWASLDQVVPYLLEPAIKNIFQNQEKNIVTYNMEN